MMILCECNSKTYDLLMNNGFNNWLKPSYSHYQINLKYMECFQISYPKERSRKPIIELTQESLDQMLLLHSLGLSNQEILEVVKGRVDV